MNTRPLALLLPLFLPLAPTSRAGSEPSATREEPELAAKIDALAAEQLARPGGVGLSIAVGRRGKLLLEKGYGLADAELDVPADERTMFRIASVTKQFTAAMVMRLDEQRKLALDDEIGKYVPEFPVEGRKVTLEALLQHTAGVRSYTDVGEPWRKLWPIELSHAELLALTEDKPFDFEPGTDWRYSNTGYYLLGMVIEKVTGKSYAEHLQADLCQPLGLARTRYDSNRELIKNRAQGYAFEGGRLANDALLGMAQPGAAGGILSTAGDLVRWQIALTSGQYVQEESFERMRWPTTLPDGRNTQYGFGLKIDEWEGRPRVYHGGGIFGFSSTLQWLPEEDLHVAVISNSEALSSSPIVDAITRAALGIERFDAKDEPIPAERIASFCGDYAFTAIGMEARLFERDGKLMMQGRGQEAFRLMWQGGLEFRADFDPDVKLLFAADGRSVEMHQRGKKAQGVRK